MKVAVFGASGFAGTAVTNRLLARTDLETVVLIRSSASAWGLARRAVPMKTVDVLDRDKLDGALDGVTHVVNCTRGDNALMFDGLKNMLEASRRHGIQRFIHLSSVAIYGDPPSPDSTSEEGATSPEKGSYGWLKLRQDRMVEAAHEKGLPCTILCPPNITGPGSPFLLQILSALRAGGFAMLDGGEAICNVADVNNLAAAVEAALENGTPTGKRYFVTDDDDVRWRDVIDGLVAGLDIAPPEIPDLDRATLQAMVTAHKAASRPTGSILTSAKHLVSGDVRAALRKDPYMEKADIFLRSLVDYLPEAALAKLRFAIAGPSIEIPRPRPETRANVPLSGQQLRGVRHSNERLKRDLGFSPPISFAQSMQAFRKAYRSMHWMDGDFGPLFAKIDR